jgi:hypothetical protein
MGKTRIKDKTTAGIAAVLLFAAALWFAHQAWFSRGQRPPIPLRWIIPQP